MSTARGVGLWSLVALTAGALVAGCGVPTQSDVHVARPLVGAEPPDGYEPLVPPGPDDANSASQLVDYFLQAAATDPENATEHLRGFIRAEDADDWQPDPQVVVVRVEDQFSTPGDRVRVRLDVRVVGSLSRGVVEPRDDTRSFELEVVTESPGMADDSLGDPGAEPRFRIVNPPDMIMLSDQALAGVSSGFLTPSPVYFWDSDGKVLVPDLRWLPTALSAAGRAQAKLKWLVDGPAPWLDSLSPLPGDVDLVGNVVSREDRLDVTLTPAAGDMDADRLNAQLWWTLQDEVDSDRPVWLTIDGQERVVEAAESANPSVTSPPSSFMLLDGAVMPYAQQGGTGLPGTATDFDEEITAAALSGDGYAALVHVGPDGVHRLRVATNAKLVDTGLSAMELGRPMWLRQPGGIGLIVAEGVLHRFAVEEPAPVEVPVPGLLEPITAVAVAPDGRRAALIADGRLYVSSLTRRDDRTVTVSAPRRLATTATNLAGVTFWQENYLAIIGEDGGQKLLYELTVDGAFERPLPNGALGAPPSVTNMVGYPGSPLEQSIRDRPEVLFEADGRVYRYRSPLDPVQIRAEDLDAELPEEALELEPRAPFYTE